MNSAGYGSSARSPFSAIFGVAGREEFITKLGREICSSGQSIKECFDQFDANKDGKISFNEFSSLAKQVNSSLSDYDVLVLFAELASVGLDDFNAALKKAKTKSALQSGPAQQLWKAIANAVESSGQSVQHCFGMIDTDSDGKISQSELWALMVKLNVSLSLEDFNHAFALVDTSCDGSISPLEFQVALDQVKGTAAAKSCLKGHPLACMTILETAGRVCDDCKAAIPMGSKAHRCLQCDYDSCEQCVASTAPRLSVKRHTYNARGGAPPYRGSYLTASDEIVLVANEPLSQQMGKLIPSANSFQRPELAAFASDQPAPRRWPDTPSPGEEKLADKLGKTAGEVFTGNKALVVLVPMVGMD